MSEQTSEQKNDKKTILEESEPEQPKQKDIVTNNIKEKKRHYYTTKPSQRSYIVNAKTGVEYPIKFNSNESRILYHVIDSTAYYDKNGYIRNRKINYINEPNHLFYDSPEQYKLHHGSNITAKQMISWHEKQKEFNINIYNTEIEYNEEQIQKTVEIK